MVNYHILFLLGGILFLFSTKITKERSYSINMNNMKLSKEKEHLVIENQPLVYYIVQKLGVAPNSSDYEDIASIGRIGLVKAAITFDLSKEIKFASYASICIKNEINMHYRKANKYANDISIDNPINTDSEGNELTLDDILEDPNSNFLEKITVKEDFIETVSIVLNCLQGKSRLVILYRMGNATQEEIGKKLNFSKSYVSRIIKETTCKIRQTLNEQLHYKEVFFMATAGDEYKISFSSKDITKFNKIFATLLQNLTSAENLPNFKVSCNSERIVIQIPANPKSFSFIAQIIQEIDDFSMAYVSNESIPDEDNISKQKTAAKPLIVKADIKETAEEKAGDKVDISSINEGGSKAKQIRNYILKVDSFTFKELKQHFPEISGECIANALFMAKKKGLITSKSRGEYVVNKK